METSSFLNKRISFLKDHLSDLKYNIIFNQDGKYVESDDIDIVFFNVTKKEIIKKLVLIGYKVEDSSFNISIEPSSTIISKHLPNK